MTRAVPRLAAVLGAVVALGAACSGGANTTNFPSAPFPFCSPPGTLSMVYPADGWSGVPATIQTVYVASSANIASQAYYSVLVSSKNVNTAGGGFFPVSESAIPKPHPTPAFPHPIYYSTFIGTVTAGATWGVAFKNGNVNCQPSLIGSFATY